MKQLSNRSLRLQPKNTVTRVDPEQAAARIEDQYYQAKLDQFCVRLGVYLEQLEAELNAKIGHIFRMAHLDFFVLQNEADGVERRRDRYDYDHALRHCITNCLARVRRGHMSLTGNELLPKIDNQTHEMIETYKKLDTLYHLAFTQDPEHRQKARVDAILEFMKITLVNNTDNTDRFIRHARLILSKDQSLGELLMSQGLFVKDQDQKQAKRPNLRGYRL